MPLQSSSTAHGTKVPWVTTTLAALLVVLQFVSSGVFEHLVFDRAAIFNGELWRLVTGHLVHLDWNHLALNAAALLGLGYLIETDPNNGRRKLLAVLIASTAAISAALLIFNPATALYAGLSGVLNGLFAFICLQFFAQTRSWVWMALITGGVLKIAAESLFGQTFTTALAWPPEPIAHFAGLIGGIAVAAILGWRKARKSWYFPWVRAL